MRIAYIIEKLSGKGGMERILTDKMNYLAEHTAHEVVCILLWHDDQPLAYPLHREVRLLRLNCPYGFAPVDFPLMTWRFRKYIRKVKPDITVYTWVAGAFLACYSGWKGKSIFESHDSFMDMRHRWLIRKASEKVDSVVTLTEDDATNFSSARSVKVIPNFTTIPTIQTDYSSSHCLWIGRLVEKKDLPRMIKIWREVIQSHPAWVLDLVGDGPEKDSLCQLIRENHLQQNVILHPFTDNVADYYSRSSIYILTSKFEGLPVVLIEAQACGLPVMAFDCDFGPRQLISDGITGYLIPYSEDSTFREKLSVLMDDESLRKNMGTAALRTSQRYRPACVMAQWLKLFREISK